MAESLKENVLDEFTIPSLLFDNDIVVVLYLGLDMVKKRAASRELSYLVFNNFCYVRDIFIVKVIDHK